MQKTFDFSDPGNEPQKFARLTDFFGQPAPSAPPPPPPDPAPVVAPARPQPVAPAPSASGKPMSVSQLNEMIQYLLKAHAPGRFLVEGEVSNCKRHGSGHVYLTIKDDRASIAAVIWRAVAAKIRFDLRDGMAVLVGGRLEFYADQGRLQVIIDKIEPTGLGALELAYRQLAEKLRTEGLFDPRHKKPLPRYPAAIAIVTSDTGAAVRDIHQTLNRRYPAVRQLLYPVRVQGDGAAAEIAAAIAAINRRNREIGPVDVIIVGRGGGSIEDLWAFNEEIVARAIFASRIPVISAVGHEVDTTIADFVADVRAATPTAAAELAVPDRNDLQVQLTRLAGRMTTALGHRLTQLRTRLDGVAQRPLFARPLERLYTAGQALDERASALNRVVQGRLSLSRRELDRALSAVRTIEPQRRVSLLKQTLTRQEAALARAALRITKTGSDRLAVLENRIARLDPRHRIDRQHKALEQMDWRLRRMAGQAMTLSRQQVTAMEQRLLSLDPKAVLNRGYSITRLASGAIVSDPARLAAGEKLITEFKAGQTVASRVIPPSDQVTPASIRKKTNRTIDPLDKDISHDNETPQN